MIESLKNYFLAKDWRIIIIELTSLALAILSASLLESKFFQIFIADKSYATAFAVIVVFSVTFVAYVIADNLQARTKRGFGYFAMIVFLLLCYGAIIASLLGMSNYTMSVVKASKDVDAVELKLAGVDNLPVVISAKESFARIASDCQKETSRLQEEINSLTAREERTGLTYVTKKQGYEKMKEQQKVRLDKAREDYFTIRNREQGRLADQSKSIATAGNSNKGLGEFLSKNPAILPVLALVILFVGRLSFSIQSTQMSSRIMTLTATKTTHSTSLTVWSHDREGWIRAIVALAKERSMGNGTGMLVKIADYFEVNKGTVFRAVKLAQSGKPINIPKKLYDGNVDSCPPLYPTEKEDT